ncbi:MAG: PTS sugar transporter subunit IIA [Phycisphaerales bacterium]|nr:PTS sugar transporter subunit IIA [Phycisphaerales bacterium]
MKLASLVPEGAIRASLSAQQRDEVITELVDALVSSGAAAPKLRDDLVRSVLEREKRGSTGFGRGVAVPHVKHKSVKKMAAAIGLSAKGVDFSALDKQPVYSVFLLLSPEDRPEDHLQAMEAIFKNLSKDTFRRFLRQAQTEKDVRTLLDEADNHLIAG